MSRFALSPCLRRTTTHTARRAGARPRLDQLEPRVVPTLLGNQLFPSDNPWNEQITNAPVAANSATLVNSIGVSSSLHADFGNGLWQGALVGIPFNTVHGTQPKVPVVIDAYASESDLLPIPIPANAVIEGDPLPSSQNTGDRHLIVYDQDNNIVYETFNTHRPSEEPDGQWHADAEAVWSLNADTFRTPGYTSADAAGLPILPGLVRPDEVLDQGRITHALRFTVPRSDSAYVYPASHEAGTNNPSLPRMGERFRLKQSFDISAFPPDDQVILQALKDYGMIVADNGSGWFISGQPSSRWNDNDLHQLGQLKGSDFEALDLTPVVTGLSETSGPTSGGSQVVISGVNFSGGAGLTKVFFGSVQATSVTVNSDGAITAVAPAQAAGTVDITVVSPYGTSATGTADQFTYTTHFTPALETFALGLDNQVYEQWLDPTGHGVGGWFRTAPGQVQALVVGHNAAGAPEVFVLGLDNQVWAQKLDATGHSLGGYTLTAPGQVLSAQVGSDAAGDPELFVVGLDGQVWAHKFDAAGNAVGGYFLTAPGRVKSVGAGHDASGRPELFVIGLDDQVWAQKLDATGSPTGGYALTTGGQVRSLSVSHDAAGDPLLFVVGLDNQVYEQHFDATGTSKGGYFLTAPGQVLSLAVGSDGGGDPLVFVLGLDGQVYEQKFNSAGTSVGGYALTAAGHVKSLVVSPAAGGGLAVLAIGLDGQVYAAMFDSTGTFQSGYVLTTAGQVQAVGS